MFGRSRISYYSIVYSTALCYIFWLYMMLFDIVLYHINHMNHMYIYIYTLVWYDLEHGFQGKKCTKGCPYLSVAQTGTVPHSRSYVIQLAQHLFPHCFCYLLQVYTSVGFLLVGLDAMTSGVMPLALGVAGQGTKQTVEWWEIFSNPWLE